MRLLSFIALAMLLGTELGRAQQPTQALDVPSDQSSTKKITPPRPLNDGEAYFSDEALQKHISGRCLVSLTVDVKGMPQEIKLVRCSDPSFEKSSLEAAAKYRFKPATAEDGNPVSFKTHIEINYQEINYQMDDSTNTSMHIRIHYRLEAPPGITSAAPSADGVYPLTKLCTPPAIIKFSDKGYGSTASFSPTGACDIVLTISTKGKAADPQVTRCERPGLEKPAVESLLKSEYTPGMVNGKAVPMRVSVHLEYGDDAAKP